MTNERTDDQPSRPHPEAPPVTLSLPLTVGPILQLVGQIILLLAALCFVLLTFAVLSGGTGSGFGQMLRIFLFTAAVGLLTAAVGEALVYLRILAARALDK